MDELDSLNFQTNTAIWSGASNAQQIHLYELIMEEDELNLKEC